MSQVDLTGGSTSTTSYGYDSAGDTTNRGTGTVTWNAIGKPAVVTEGTTTQSDVYDSDGGLLLQSDSVGGSTLFLGATELHVAVGSSTVRATRAYSRGSTPVAERSTLSGTTVLTWLLADQQDTVSAQLLDSSGALTVRRQDPFGQSRSGAAAAWGDGHGFLNAATSTVTGLTQLGARLYDASLGRFLSVDAVLSPFNPVQNNGYSYAGNSPIGRSDPSGNYWVGGSLGDCGSSGCSGIAGIAGTGGTGGTGGTKGSSPKKGPSAKKGPSLGSVLGKYWDTSLDNEGQFLSGIGEGLYGIGKFFLWDSSIIGTSIKAADSIGCLANWSSCEKQQEAAAAPWQKHFWGTAEKTFIQPTLDDFANHPAHAIGKLVPDLAMFAIPGGGLVKGARVAEEADAAATAGAALTRPMEWESANAAFTASGELKQQAVDGSRKIIDGTQLNSRLQANLTADGSNIADWGKYSTQTIRGPAGDFQVHFYMNGRTGAIDYNYDYKAVLNGGK